jgi:hypothetical protein
MRKPSAFAVVLMAIVAVCGDARILPVGGTGRQPTFTLDISAAGGIGSIVVKDQAGAKVQTLTCALSIYSVADPSMLPKQIDFQDGTFVDSVKAMDLDFDGLPDIQGVRDFGGKWAKHCVWLYDPNRGRFIQDALSRQMEDLENLGVDAQSRLVFAYTIGPTLPTRDEYRIDSRSEVRGERRLLPVRSCQLDTGAAEGAVRTVKVVRYSSGQEAVERRTVSADCNDPCGDGCPTLPGKKAAQ